MHDSRAADLIFNMTLTMETQDMKDQRSCQDWCCLRSRLCLGKVQEDFLPSHLLPSAESRNVCLPLIVMTTNAEMVARLETPSGSRCLCMPTRRNPGHQTFGLSHFSEAKMEEEDGELILSEA